MKTKQRRKEIKIPKKSGNPRNDSSMSKASIAINATGTEVEGI